MDRTSQTKQLLANSLKNLMKKVPFGKITVQNVTDYCGLNRQTFYYHFTDLQALLEWIYQNEIFQKISDANNQDWESIVLASIKYAKQNKAFLKNTNRSLRKETEEKFLYPIVNRWMLLVFKDTCGETYLGREDTAFLLNFFTRAFVDAIIQWIGTGLQGDEEYILRKLHIITDMFKQFEKTQATPASVMAGWPR